MDTKLIRTLKKVYELYAILFARPVFERMNRVIMNFGRKGLGALNYNGYHLTGESYFLKKQIADLKNPVVFDVGANNGDYVKLVFDANKNSRVYCFEPHPISYKKLVEKLGDNSQVTLINKALGNETGELKFYDWQAEEGTPPSFFL